MKKLIYFNLIFLFFSFSLFYININAQSPQLDWAKKFGGTEGDFGYSVAIDQYGNVYTSGRFEGTVDFDPGIGVNNITSNGETDIYVSKFNASGEFLWAKSIKVTYRGITHSIITDQNNNILLVGYFGNTADFDPNSGTFFLTTIGFYDIFILKLDESGNFIDVKKLGGPNQDYGRDIVLDALGNIYTTGHFWETADFDPSTGVYNLTSSGDQDIFMSKLDLDGNFIWAKKLGGTGADISASSAIDEMGNTYIVGHFQNTADLDLGIGLYNLTSFGSNDIFVAKYNTDGEFIWAKQIGGTLPNESYSIALDENDNVCFTGIYSGTCDFDPSAATFNLTSNGDQDIFISKLDIDGNFIWAKSIGGSLIDRGSAITTDIYDNVYTTGNFQGIVDFDPGLGNFNINCGSNGNAFISKLDSAGNFIWAVQLEGNSIGNGTSIIVDSLGDIYTAGDFQGTVDFDPNDGTFNLTSAGDYDIFIHKMSQNLSSSVYSNPTSCFGAEDGTAWVSTFNGIPPYTYLWSPGGSANDTIFNLGAGTYFVTITDSIGTIVVDSIVILQPNLLTVSIETPIDTVCLGNFIDLNATANGGTLPYNYLWSTNNIDTLSLNSVTINMSEYVSILVTDLNNCIAKDSLFITVQNPPILISSADTCICLGGIATLTASGTPSYLWSTGDTTSVISVSPNITSNYIVSYTDGICSASDTTLVCVYPVASVNAFIINSISCYGANDGVASVSVEGGTPPYSFSWEPNGSLNDTLFDLSPGSYIVTVYDSACAVGIDSVFIIEPDLLTMTVSAENDTVCFGNSIDLTAIASGGTFPYNYVWSTSSLDTLALNNATLNISQYVSAVATDLNNCMVQDSIFITVQNPPLLISSADTCICLGGIATLTASGIPTYLWNTGDTTSVISVSPNITSNYIVSYNDGICSASDITLVCVNPNPFVMASEDTSMANNASVLLEAFGDSPFYWSPSNSLSCNPCSNPIASPENSTVYLVTVTNEFGCSAQDTVTIEVYYYQLIIPNVITPNQDGLNDTFRIIGLPEKAILTIFNRWGNEIFSSHSYQNDWKTVIDGVYYYILNTPDGKSFNGNIQVNGN